MDPYRGHAVAMHHPAPGMAYPPPPIYMGPPPMALPPPPMLHGYPGMLGPPPRARSSSRAGRRKTRGGAKDSKDERTQTVLSKQMQKTRLCDFHKEGRCKYGSACAFAHSQEELKDMPDLRKTRICRSFTQGKCSSTNCKFAHGNEELRTTDFYKEAKLLQEESAAQDGPGRSTGPKTRFNRRMRQRMRKHLGRPGAGAGGPDARSPSPQADGDGSSESDEDEFASKRSRTGCVSSAICPRCGSTIASHLGYTLCAICRA
mmetsp:Transcript_87416/g.270644  ORF Transcript_87416/g.270644 Transcript_87416/m.270644 type:complete len:260 (+) Transcript_87416:99-878(+)